MRLVIDTDALRSGILDHAPDKLERTVLKAVARELDEMGKFYLEDAERLVGGDQDDERQTGERLRAAAREIRWAVRKVWTLPSERR